ncbi:longifolia [Castilleja foliolosa]|uniref:Longifolia n=1 Tax=Castilleja foliolosa TaxID=1961234 RepID=A0ABD3D4A4_9LAMI
MPCDVYENRNLRKQIGCMKGIFQLFDFHHFLTSSNKHKRLLLGGQHQLESHNATKATTGQEIEVQKQKPRISTESSQAAPNSSSTCSSTFSLLDHNRANISESPFHIRLKKQQQTKGLQFPHIREVVKDSMHREARGVPIKSFKNDEQKKVTVMKHIDSPRLLHKPKIDEESNRVFRGDERLMPRRFSYDGRESRDYLKMKHKELPRLSLDSKASSIKCSGLYSRSDFLGQESGGHSRTSSIVAKLMGLDDFPDTITTAADSNFKMPSPGPGPSVDFPSNSKQAMSPRQPMEPAPWKQARSRKSPKITQNSPSSSVYAEMEKRITDLEFKRSGKDLRALKQILGAMQKTRDKLENESHEPQMQKQMPSSHRITTSAKAMEKVRFPNFGKVPTVEKMHRRGEKTKELNNMKEPTHCFSSIDKKTNFRKSKPEQNLTAPPQRMRVFETASPKPGHNVPSSLGRSQKQSSKKVGEICSPGRKTKVNNSTGFQLSDDGLSELSSEVRYTSYPDDTASVKSESTSSAKPTDPNCREKQNYISTSKEHKPEVELTVTLIEQPSPVSVLDTTFFIEELPSPMKKISTVFQDESPGPDEAEWPVENLNHFTQYSPVYKYKTAINHNESEHRGLIPDQEYINKILVASGLFKDKHILPTANLTINPGIFPALEEIKKETRALIKKNELNQRMQRQIVFDSANEILVHKITNVGRGKRISLQGIMREFYLEMDYLCGTAYRNFDDDEDDGSIRLITTDMKYRSDEWADYSGEVPAMVLEIERLIFKDLINEVVKLKSQVEGLRDWPKKHCRQLFTK